MDYLFFYFEAIILFVAGSIFLTAAIVDIFFNRVSSGAEFTKFFVLRDIAIALISVVILFGSFFLGIKRYDTLDARVSEGYAIYLDGQQVDAETISFSQYKISINDTNKTIYLTQKNERWNNYMPVIIPK